MSPRLADRVATWFGQDDEDALWRVECEAEAAYRRSDVATAESRYRRLVNGQRRMLGDDHPETLGSMRRLADMVAMRDPGEARRLRELVLAGWRACFDDGHPDALEALDLLACELSYWSGGPDALPTLEWVLDDQTRLLGPDHPSTLDSVHNFAEHLHLRSWDPPAVRALLEENLRRRREVLGDTSPAVEESWELLIEALREQCEWGAAAATIAEQVTVKSGQLGAGHWETLRAIGRLALVHEAAGDAGALRALRREVAGLRPADRLAAAELRRLEEAIDEYLGDLGRGFA